MRTQKKKKEKRGWCEILLLLLCRWSNTSVNGDAVRACGYPLDVSSRRSRSGSAFHRGVGGRCAL